VIRIGNEKLIENYRTLNTAERGVLVFQLTSRGFLSEINNMLLAMLYCLENEMEFVLYSRSWVAGCDKGWQDYFIPFCNEQKNILFYRRSAFRLTGRREHVLNRFQKLFFRECFNAHDIWHLMTAECFLARHFDIPELGINGDVFHAKQVLLRIVYRYNPDVYDRVRERDDLLSNFQPFVGIHVRRGDKIKETKLIPVNRYFEKFLTIEPKMKSVFIATDSYEVVDEFKSLCPESVRVVSFCQPVNMGYSQTQFNGQKPLCKKEQMICFLTDLHFLAKSTCFIGTYSSNIARIVALFIGREACSSLDVSTWPAD